VVILGVGEIIGFFVLFFWALAKLTIIFKV